MDASEIVEVLESLRSQVLRLESGACEPPERSESVDSICAICGEPTNDLAADPGAWPLRFTTPDGTGRARPHHIRCVQARVYPREVEPSASERRSDVYQRINQRVEEMGLGINHDENVRDPDEERRNFRGTDISHDEVRGLIDRGWWPEKIVAELYPALSPDQIRHELGL